MSKTGKTSSAYLIRCLSSLHVGAGDANYGVIDNQVQRELLTQLPIIHASSLKGALREYFEYQIQQNWTKMPKKEQLARTIFGHSHKSNNDQTEKQQFKAGLFDFDVAFLLSLPVRTNKAAYASVTTVRILRELIDRLAFFDLPEDERTSMIKQLNQIVQQPAMRQASTHTVITFDPDMQGAKLEEDDYTAHYETLGENAYITLQKLLGENPMLMEETAFRELANSLPVIARNCLENGESKNLWYEEVVPRESRFYTIITKAQKWEEEEQDTNWATYFDTILTSKQQLIQIGANATIGYGKTHFNKLKNQLA